MSVENKQIIRKLFKELLRVEGRSCWSMVLLR
jgi:hypothetical protein